VIPILKPGTTKGVSSVYKVTIRQFSYPLFFAETQIQKEESKQLPQQHVEENKIREPIPLPMALTSSSTTDSNIDRGDNFAIPILPHPEDKYEKATSELVLGEGPGKGVGGSNWVGSGEGQGVEQEGIRSGGLGEGVGTMGQSSGWVIPGKGTGMGKRGHRGGPGNGGTGGPHPRYAENPKPVYPMEAREKGCEGEVLLRVEVLSNGRVGQIEVKKSSGYEILDQSALTTVKRWRFIPAKKGEVPIPFWVNIPIKFQLL